LKLQRLLTFPKMSKWVPALAFVIVVAGRLGDSSQAFPECRSCSSIHEGRYRALSVDVRRGWRRTNQDGGLPSTGARIGFGERLLVFAFLLYASRMCNFEGLVPGSVFGGAFSPVLGGDKFFELPIHLSGVLVDGLEMPVDVHVRVHLHHHNLESASSLEYIRAEKGRVSY
jgi:hypothetical protein